MKLKLFKPEDFVSSDSYIDTESAAIMANKILNDYVNNLPKVFQMKLDSDFWHPIQTHNALINSEMYLKSASLICIEEIKPKECKHEKVRHGTILQDHNPCPQFVCLNCGDALKQKSGWGIVE